MAISEVEQALEHFKDGNPAAAIPILESVVRLVPSYIIAHVMLAQAYESTMQEEKAVQAWERAHSLIPNSPLRDSLPPMEIEDPDFAAFMDHLREIDGAGPEWGAGPARPSAPVPAIVPAPVSMIPENASVLSAEGLVKRYKKRAVVKAISLEVRQGEIVGLLGPNGAGKTTTFYMIVGMIGPEKGQVRLDNRDITRLPMFERARLGIGYLAQEASIFSQMSVEQNLEAVLEYQRMTRAARLERVEELIHEFGLERVRRSKGYMLSGGERRRTEIARALATRPKFFLLDEPFAGVDPIAVEDIQAIVSALKARGIGVLITDHNVHETLAITDRAYLLYEGKILKQGTAEALAADAEVRERYLGEKFTLERYK